MPAKVTLTILGGALDGTEYAFDKPTRGVIGRSEDCSVRLPNRGWTYQMVSRHHCQLDIDPPCIRVWDLGSLNGTYINGRPTGKRAAEEMPEASAAMPCVGHELHDADILAVGPVHFRVNVKETTTAEVEPVESVAEMEAEAPGAEENVKRPAEQMMFVI
jgi:pSer/pThr/pTyr-binding forkhead associated (FHA) protein